MIDAKPYPTYTCTKCLRQVEVVQTSHGYPPDVAKRKLERACKANGCACEPSYLAGVTFGGPVVGQ